MPAQPLSLEQKSDAQRLAVLFRAWQQAQKNAGRPHSQESATEHLGFNQSALSQYLRGVIPLNVRVLAKFCRLLDCDPSAISPALAREMKEIAEPFANPSSAPDAATSSAYSPLRAQAMKLVLNFPEDRLGMVVDVLLALGRQGPGLAKFLAPDGPRHGRADKRSSS